MSKRTSMPCRLLPRRISSLWIVASWTSSIPFPSTPSIHNNRKQSSHCGTPVDSSNLPPIAWRVRTRSVSSLRTCQLEFPNEPPMICRQMSKRTSSHVVFFRGASRQRCFKKTVSFALEGGCGWMVKAVSSNCYQVEGSNPEEVAFFFLTPL